MAEIELIAGARSEFGKGAARRVRRAGYIPAVLYGHGADPIHITLPAHETMLALRQANALLEIALPDGKKQLALPKQVQRDPIRDAVEHVDLVIVRKGERVTVEVPLTLTGDVESGALLVQDRTFITVQAEATGIPVGIEVSVAGLSVGTQLTLADVQLPVGVELADNPEVLVLAVSQPHVAAPEESAEDAASAAVEDASAGSAESAA
ncbi:MAG: 50S ribosomal protein L25/general stress protein Ctc [Propionibacteriaceae bacterium]|jgi:large subunit ribosomal protein L25|nr:50S ribosomal protein L25/general stress protein Ctc [Propionibacteriaceae bacterium]